MSKTSSKLGNIGIEYAPKHTVEVSRGKKTRMVVIIQEVKGVKNRKGKPYLTSVTKHLSLKPKQEVKDA